MLPRDKSITTLSKSITSKPGGIPGDSTASDISRAESAETTPIQFVKGVGPRLGTVFKNRQIDTVKDLVFFFPRTYEDRSRIYSVSNLEEGVIATLSVRVLSQKKIPIQKLGRSLLEVRCTDDTGTMSLKWFYTPRGIEKKFIPGAQLTVTGKVKLYLGKPEIVHPEISWGVATDSQGELEAQPHVGRIVPVYVELEGIPSRTFRKVLWEALEKYGNTIREDIPQYLLERHSLPGVSQSVRNLHFPPEDSGFELATLEECDTPAHRRLIYGEFFKFEYLILRHKLNIERALAPPLDLSVQSICEKQMPEWLSLLPFRLTSGQTKALEDIFQDFSKEYPMNRLIQGDVGSGKTAVAFLSALVIMAGGGQVALMAPTEILAEQHFKSAFKLFRGKLNVALLTGKSSSSERKILQSKLSSGQPVLVIGTHALIEDSVVFARLAYVIIDEQHRFGVEQRKTLKLKGVKKSSGTRSLIFPHSLLLTATPIPRTLALTAFGELSVTSIRELPPGRSPIVTRVVKDEGRRKQAYEHIKKDLREGRQAYFIFPLIHQSEAEGFTQLKSAVTEAQLLAEEIFPEFSIGLLHGQMSSDEKEQVMEKFKKCEYHVLVSTTVVEVGVDVPNATVIAIEHSERFGLSQLHQLRGRVGRGQHQSYCYLFSSNAGKSSNFPNPRLEVLEETCDGFKIAEADLEIRGPGEFLGVRQAGALPFRIADLIRDREWLFKARDDVTEILSKDPKLMRPEHACLKQISVEATGRS